MLLPNDQFCLLDWEYAGFYPRAFEIYCLRFTAQSDPDFYRSFLNVFEETFPWIEDLVEKERQIGMLNRVYRNNLKYGFGQQNSTDCTKLRMLVEQFKAIRQREITTL